MCTYSIDPQSQHLTTIKGTPQVAIKSESITSQIEGLVTFNSLKFLQIYKSNGFEVRFVFKVFKVSGESYVDGHLRFTVIAHKRRKLGQSVKTCR